MNLKKSIAIMFAVGTLLAAKIQAALPSLYSPVTILAVLQFPSGQTYFQSTGFATTRWWYIDGTTSGGKGMLSTLLTAKTQGVQVQFYGTVASTGSSKPTTDTFNCDVLQLP